MIVNANVDAAGASTAPAAPAAATPYFPSAEAERYIDYHSVDYCSSSSSPPNTMIMEPVALSNYQCSFFPDSNLTDMAPIDDWQRAADVTYPVMSLSEQQSFYSTHPMGFVGNSVYGVSG